MKPSFFPKIVVFLSIIAFLTPATAAVSESCRSALLELPSKKNFTMKDLLTSVIKVKGLCKMKFTCPLDNSVTDVGLTAGCVKELPEDLGGLQQLAQDIGLDMAMQQVQSQLYAEPPPAAMGSSNYYADDDQAPPPPRRRTYDEEPADPSEKGKFSIGVLAGVNFSTIIMGQEESDFTEGRGSKFGVQTGVVFDIPLSKIFYLSPGLKIAQMGAKSEENDEEQYYNGMYYTTVKETYTETITAYYVKIPLLFTVKNYVSEKVALRINAGPYLAYALGEGLYEREGKYYIDGQLQESGSYSRKLFEEECIVDYDGYETYYDCEQMADPFDFGLSIGGGVQFYGFYIGVFYDYGLANIYSTTNSDTGGNKRVISNRSMGFDFGYFF